MVDGQCRVELGPCNVSRVVTKPEASATYESVFFEYARNGRTVTHVVGEQWQWDGAASCVPAIDYGRTFASEFRYDGARQRYLTRRLIPDTLQPYGTTGDTWTDYDGDEAYGDFSVDASLGSFVSNKRSFEPGLGRFEWLSSNEPDGSTASYYHTDHLGTIRGVTDYIARWGEAMTFTAFGERVVGTQDSYSRRYGYVGSFGYQASGEYPFLHVGARYYDPGSGRFLQRDPIGIRGGLNVYAYSRSAPTVIVDPDGMRYQLPNIGPPPATGPSDEGMFDPIWTPVHYSAGYLADMLHIDFMDTLWWAIWYEEWEPNFWPGYRENRRNRIGDVISACIGWFDSHF
jgi:RHS repeat-associated protein